MNKMAIIQFPGTNCEYETLRAIRHYGVQADLVRWNEPLDSFSTYEGFVLPGGFSFQDRVRAGAIAAKLPVMSVIQQAASAGKPVLGICNGCQILAEAGLFPNTHGSNHLEVALAPNQRDAKPLGFVCDWVNVKVINPQNSLFTRYFSSEDVIPIPINHGEGRFVLESELDPTLTFLQYCMWDGYVLDSYPTNPNGASHNIAAIASPQGNVMGMMPHPERAAFLKQVPSWIQGPWGEKKHAFVTTDFYAPGPWEKLFVSLKEYLL